jgi:hypothetical protein
MDSHPVLTTAVYILIAVAFVSVVAYMIVYTTRLKSRRTTEALLGRPPVSKEEGIAVATMEKEHPERNRTT